MLHQLKDGRFQIVWDGDLASILTGYGYVLATVDVIELLRAEGVSVDERPAIVYDPTTKVEIKKYRELRVAAVITAETIDVVDLQQQLWLHDNSGLFVAPRIGRRLAELFPDLVISEAFFVGQERDAPSNKRTPLTR